MLDDDDKTNKSKVFKELGRVPVHQPHQRVDTKESSQSLWQTHKHTSKMQPRPFLENKIEMLMIGELKQAKQS